LDTFFERKSLKINDFRFFVVKIAPKLHRFKNFPPRFLHRLTLIQYTPEEPTRSIGFGITLWPTASMFYMSVEDFSTKLRRNHDFAAIMYSGDGDGR